MHFAWQFLQIVHAHEGNPATAGYPPPERGKYRDAGGLAPPAIYSPPSRTHYFYNDHNGEKCKLGKEGIFMKKMSYFSWTYDSGFKFHPYES
jgi:hypothetical protein